MLKGIKKKKKVKIMNIKMSTVSQLSATESERQIKQLEQEQNRTYGNHLECYCGRERVRMGERYRD